MASESTRELILQNMKTSLEAIDGEDPYWTEVTTVRRVPLVPTEFEGEEKPGLLIVQTSAPETVEHKHNYHDVRNMEVGVIGVIDRPAGDVGAVVNRFMKDVSIALMADVTRGGNASMTFKQFQTDLSNLFLDLCLFEMGFVIRYHCDGRLE